MIRAIREVVIVFDELEVLPHGVERVGWVIEDFRQIVEVVPGAINKVDQCIVESASSEATSARVPEDPQLYNCEKKNKQEKLTKHCLSEP